MRHDNKCLTRELALPEKNGNETWSIEIVSVKTTVSNIKATHTYAITEVYSPEKYELNKESFEFSIDFIDGFTGEYAITNIKQYVPSLGFKLYPCAGRNCPPPCTSYTSNC